MARVLVTFGNHQPINMEPIETVLDDHDVETLDIPTEDRLEPAAQDILVDALEDHAGIITRGIRVTRRAVQAAPDLEVVSTHSAGYDHLDIDTMTEQDVVAIHNPDGIAPAVVEHTFGMVFSLLRDLPRRYDLMAQGEWYEARNEQPEFGRRTVGVIGLGTIGFEVARIVSEGFGAETIAHDPYVTGERSSRIYPRVDRETVEAHGIELVDHRDIFERADIVLVHVPLTAETRGSISESEFDRLDGGVIINVARGPVIDETALLAALEDGRVDRAGLDVFEQEPTDNEALLSHENVQSTPHIAGFTDGFMARMPRLAAQRLLAVLEGDRPDYIINPIMYD
jgi:D-3-phosphoglycerate dehydrogenase